MTKVFICYRRDDSQEAASRLHQDLCRVFRPLEVFRDERSIPEGISWNDEIGRALKQCDVVLVLIGKRWAPNRLHEEGDVLARELRTALQSRKLVIPVLVGEADMPDESSLPSDLEKLPQLQARRLREDSWEHDVDQLIARANRHLHRHRASHRLAALAAGFLLGGLFSLSGFLDRTGFVKDLDNLAVQWISQGQDRSLPYDKVSLIAAQGYEDDATTHERAEWRRQHARMIRGLARAGARVVVFDAYFEMPLNEALGDDPLSPDQQLSEAITEARRLGTEVVIGVRTMLPADPQDVLDLPKPMIADSLKEAVGDGWGLVALEVDSPEGRLLEFDLGRPQKEDSPSGKLYLWPTLPLLALMRYRGTQEAYCLRNQGEVRLEGKGDWPAIPAQLRRPTAIREFTACHGWFPGISVLQEESYSNVLDLMRRAENSDLDEYLRRKFDGRIVLVGFRSRSDLQATQRVAGFEEFSGFQIQAMVISSLLQQTSIHKLTYLQSSLVLLVVSVLGVAWGDIRHRLLGRNGRVGGSAPYVLAVGGFLVAGMALIGAVYLLAAAILMSGETKVLLTPVNHVSAFVISYVALSLVPPLRSWKGALRRS